MKRKVRSKPELYETMRASLDYIREHASERPSVALLARNAGMSSSRFEHAFREWVGTTPQRFLARMTKERAKEALSGPGTILQASLASGLSGPGRLHELMVTYEAVSPGEFRDGGIKITYGVHDSPFGLCLIGVTKRGICHLSFVDADDSTAQRILRAEWPAAHIARDNAYTKGFMRKIFTPKISASRRPIHLLIKGTNFQIKVWEALLAIPRGETASYSDIARKAGVPKAVRAVGSACRRNTIGFLIPCHRVLTSGGGLGGYRWGTERKAAMLEWERGRGGEDARLKVQGKGRRKNGN